MHLVPGVYWKRVSSKRKLNLQRRDLNSKKKRMNPRRAEKEVLGIMTRGAPRTQSHKGLREELAQVVQELGRGPGRRGLKKRKKKKCMD